jgi:vacuolar-type H+-ATPase subunit H
MPQILNYRVEMLEQQMEALSTLPDRVTSLESQILQFRVETRAEFAAVREEMRRGDEDTRREMHVLHAETLQRFDTLREEIRDEMHSGDAETRRHMRLLHEEVMTRIALLDERWNGTPKKTPAGTPPRPKQR